MEGVGLFGTLQGGGAVFMYGTFQDRFIKFSNHTELRQVHVPVLFSQSSKHLLLLDSHPVTCVFQDVSTTLLFTRPAANPDNYSPGVNAIELPAGKIVEFLLGFENKGEEGECSRYIK